MNNLSENWFFALKGCAIRDKRVASQADCTKSDVARVHNGHSAWHVQTDKDQKSWENIESKQFQHLL